jgi:hypothetical protein
MVDVSENDGNFVTYTSLLPPWPFYYQFSAQFTFTDGTLQFVHFSGRRHISNSYTAGNKSVGSQSLKFHQFTDQSQRDTEKQLLISPFKSLFLQNSRIKQDYYWSTVNWSELDCLIRSTSVFVECQEPKVPPPLSHQTCMILDSHNTRQSKM